MGKKNKEEEGFSEEVISDDSEIVDAGNFEQAERPAQDPLEKEEREAAKKDAKPAPSGAYVVGQNMKVDGKMYKRGDAYEGKLYQDLIDAKALIPASEWQSR